jgi:hypothetical protein
MITLKNVMPVHFEKYNALVQQQTSSFSAGDLARAYRIAADVVVKLLASR